MTLFGQDRQVAALGAISAPCSFWRKFAVSNMQHRAIEKSNMTVIILSIIWSAMTQLLLHTDHFIQQI